MCDLRVSKFAHWTAQGNVIPGLPCVRSARGTESHTHGTWSTSFRLVVTWLTERTYVRVYTLYGWDRGEYQKEGRGVSGVSLQVLIFYIGILNMVNWQLSKCDSHWPVSYDHIVGSCQLIEVMWFIWKLSADQLVLLDRKQCSISYFFASLGSEHRKTDTHIGHQCCDQLTAVKTRYPLTSITWVYRGLRCRLIEVK